MRILIFTNYFPPEMGAASNRIFYLASGLKNLGHNVEVVAPLPNYPKGKIFEQYRGKFKFFENMDGIGVHRYWIYATISKNAFSRALGMVSFAASFWAGMFKFRSKKPDLVIIQHSPLFVSFSALILSSFFPECKRILNVSDLWPLSALELGVMHKGHLYNTLEKIELYNYRHSDLIMGQSNEILHHVKSKCGKPLFLYRNIAPEEHRAEIIKFKNGIKIIYAGLLGVAQGVFEICRNVNFKKLGVEFHIYGGGHEESMIKEYIEQNTESNIFYHGSVSKAELHKILPQYHASIVPLANRIYGAVPSKIYELISLNVPILFCGGGEGSDIVKDNRVGFISEPGDFKQLSSNISKFVDMDEQTYKQLMDNCTAMTSDQLNFQYQIEQLNNRLKNITNK